MSLRRAGASWAATRQRMLARPPARTGPDLGMRRRSGEPNWPAFRPHMGRPATRPLPAMTSASPHVAVGDVRMIHSHLPTRTAALFALTASLAGMPAAPGRAAEPADDELKSLL